MYKCNRCGNNDCYLDIVKTDKGNLQVMICKKCGDATHFFTQSECTDKENGINAWAKSLHDNAVMHGWWDEPRNNAEIIALCHSELSEALECMRKGEPAEWFIHQMGENEFIQTSDPEKHCPCAKTEGSATELIDCVIRIFDFLAHEGIDIEGVMLRKNSYNSTRPHKHGKKF